MGGCVDGGMWGGRDEWLDENRFPVLLPEGLFLNHCLFVLSSICTCVFEHTPRFTVRHVSPRDPRKPWTWR